MFKRLQRRILLLNMALISVVMLAAFAGVYTITWRNVQLENQRVLDSTASAAVSFMFSVDNPTLDASFSDGVSIKAFNFNNGGIEPSGMSIRQVSVEYALSFSVEIDDFGNVLNVDSIIDMPRESYVSAVERALAQDRGDGTISLDGKVWMYSIGHPMGYIERLIDSQVLDIEIMLPQMNRQISFLDVTESRLTLRNLLITLSAVGALVLVVFYFISYYFSKRAVKPIAEAWEKQKRFIADASHELKTPLTIISANCDALLTGGHETVDSQRKWVDHIQAGTDRMARLTGQLLALAKMDENGTEAAAHEAADVSTLAQDAIRSMEIMAGRRGLEITCCIEPGIVIHSDGGKISTVIGVLLENAVKYAGSRIEVILRKEKRRVCFIVKNDGKGISREELPKVFDRFYKGDESRDGDGSYGLGLSIAKAVMESLNGDITAESEEGGDTVFTMLLLQ